MIPYNVELFTPEFEYRASAQVEYIDHEYDYLDITKAAVKIPGTITAKKGDWIHITRNAFEANGIISDIKSKKDSVTLEYKPFNKLFDITAYVDPMELQTVSLEKWLKDQIEKIYVNNSDQLQNIAGLTVTVISEHQGAAIERYETGLNNLYDIIVEAFMSYGIVCTFTMDVQRKRLNLLIGSRDTDRITIEADLGNVFEKEVTIKEAQENTNKLIVYNEEDYTQKIVYYLTKNNEITTENKDRITPVICGQVTAKATTKITFEEAAQSKVEKTLKTSEYDNLIEITVSVDDPLVRPTQLQIGQTVEIISDGMRYNTVLTGINYASEKITLIFGAIRLELTKILKRRFRENGN